MKRVISMFLAVILTVTSLPISLFAEDSYTLTPEQIAELVAGGEIAPIISEEVPTDLSDPEIIVDDTISDISEVVEGDSAPSAPIDDADTSSDDDAKQVDAILPESPDEDTTIGETTPENEMTENIGDEVVFDEITTETYSAPDLYAPVIVSGTCGAQGDNLTWTVTDDGTLTISGTGAMENYSDGYFAPWWYAYDVEYYVNNVIIEYGVTSIGDDAFRWFEIESVTIPNSVTSIGDYAFEGCSSLTSITIPDSVTRIGDSAFENCIGLISLEILGNITQWGEYVFACCENLSTVVIGEGATSVGQEAFLSCWNLSIISLPNTLKSIGSGAFSACESLTTIELPNSVKRVEDYAFSGCTNLISVVFPESCTYIGSYMFEECPNNISVTILNKTATIGEHIQGYGMLDIKGYANSTAHAYALDNSLWFVHLDPHDFGSWESYGDGHIRYCQIEGCIVDADGDSIFDTSPYMEYAAHDFIDKVYIGDCPNSGYTEHICANCGYMDWDTETPPIYNHVLNESLFDLGIYQCVKCGAEFNGPLLDCSITVRDAETAKPIEGATIIFGSFGITTDATGTLSFQTDNTDACELRIIAENYPEFYISDYNISKVLNDDIYLTSTITDIYSVVCNNIDVLNSKTQINVGAYKLKANFSVIGRAVADILRYELIQCDKVIATSSNGKFSVPNTRFLEDKDIYVRMYTNGLTNNVHERKLNISVLDYTFSFSADLKKLLPLSGGLDITYPEGVPILSGMNVKSGLFLPEDRAITIEYDNNSVLISYGTEDSEEKKLSLKEKFKKLLDSFEKTKSEKTSTGYSFAIIAEYDEFGISKAYGEMVVGFTIENSYGKSFVMAFIPVYGEFGYSLDGRFEINNIGYDFENTRFLIPESAIEIGGSITGRAGIGFGVASAGLYGRLGARLRMSTAVIRGFESFTVSGEMGLYAKINVVFWKKTYEYAIFSGAHTWYGTSARLLYASPLSLENYEKSTREYLNDRSEWLGEMQTFSESEEQKCLQVSSYDLIEPIVVTAGDTTMMVFLDDDSREGNNYQHLYYSLYNEDTNTWATPKKVDNNDFCDAEYELYSDGKKVYVAYTQIEANLDEVSDNDYSFLSDAEVIVAEYDATTDQFINYTNVSNNDAYDTLPRLSFNNEQLTVAWISNTSDDVFMQNVNNSIYACVYENGVWSEPQLIIDNMSTISAIDIGVLGGNTYISTVYDIDCNYETIDDKYIRLYSLDGTSFDISTLYNDNDKVSFETLDGINVLTWYSHDNIYYISDVTPVPNQLFDEGISEFSNIYKIVDIGNGRYAVLFNMSEQYMDENGETVTSSNIYGVFRNNGEWGNPVQVTSMRDGRYIDDFDCTVFDDNLIIPYISAEATFEGNNMSVSYNFMSAKLDARYDLAVDDVYCDYTSLMSGSTVDISALVSNKSWNRSNSINLSIYDSSNNVIYSELKTIEIESGSSQIVEISVSKNLFVKGAQYYLNVSPVGAYDENLENNITSLNLWYSDLSVEATQVYGPQTSTLRYKVTNEGNMPGGGVLKVVRRLDDGNEVELHQEQIFLPEAGYMTGSLEVTSNFFESGVDEQRIYVTVIPSSEEFYSGNDSTCVMIDHSTLSFTTEVTDTSVTYAMPAIQTPSVEYNKMTGGSLSVFVTENDGFFVGLSNVESTAYVYNSITPTISEEYTGILTISEEYLRNLEVGVHEISLQYLIGGEMEEIFAYISVSNGGYLPVTITAPDVVIKYDGKPTVLGVDVTYQTDSSGIVSSRYSIDGATWFDGLPTDVGVYRAEICVSQDDLNLYESASCQITLEITKASRAISSPKTVYELDGIVYFCDSNVTVGENDGVIQYGYSALNDVATVASWSSIGVLPESDGNQTYYVFARIIDGINFVDAYSVDTLLDAHTWDDGEVTAEPTCINDGVKTFTCIECGATYIEPLVASGEHIYSEWEEYDEENHIRYCVNNGCAQKEIEKHSFGDSSDICCTACTYAIIAYGVCGSNLTWYLNNEYTLIISGAGDMTNYDLNGAPWDYFKAQIKNVIISEGATSLGSYALSDCSGLTSVTIPESVISIGDSAFLGCINLTKITFLNPATTIYSSSTTINETATICGYAGSTAQTYAEIYNMLFVSICESLIASGACGDSLTWELTNYGNLAIYGMGDMTDFKLSSATWYGFSSQIKSVVICEGVTSIGSYAFSNCSSLTTITIPQTLTSIGNSAFVGCSALTNIVVPESVASIDYGAFNGCTGLTSITFLNATTKIYDSSNTISLTATIFGYYSSTAQTYAEKYCRKFAMLHTHIYDDWHKLDFKNHIRYCTDVDCAAFEKVPHSWNCEVTTYPTCVNTGTKTYTCTECEAILIESVPVTGNHTYGNWQKHNDDKHIHYCIGADCDASETADHVWNNGAVTTEPTCAIEGVKTFTCDECGATYTELVPATGNHTFNDWEYFDGSMHTRACTDIACGGEEFEEHKYNDIYCSVCGYVKNTAVVASGYCGDNLTWMLCDDGTLVILGSGAMENYSSTSPWYSYRSSIKSVVIDDGVESIGNYAFYKCTLTSVTIPDSVISIGHSAFGGCSKLTSVYITDLEVWCNISFGNTESNPLYYDPLYYAKTLYLNDELVTNLVIPDSVTSIGDYAFRGCSSLTSITIPDSVISIGDYAFHTCSSLTSVTIGDSVTSIGSAAFGYCSKLTSVYITDLEAWFNISFSSSYSNPLYYAKKLYINDELVTNLVIPDGITSIGNYAFENCSSLTSVTIPDSVISIGNSAFCDCSSLTSIVFESADTTIYDSSYTITSNATIYGYEGSTAQSYAEEYNRTFVKFCDGNHIFGDWKFIDVNVHTRHCVDITCYGEEFEEHKYNDIYCSVCGCVKNTAVVDSGCSGDDLMWILCDDGTLVILGNGAMEDYSSYSSVPWYSYRSSIKSIVIDDGVESIGKHAFYKCALTSVTIPDSVTSIGNSAFEGCSSLTSIVFESADTTIYDSSYTLPSNTTIYGHTNSTAQSYAQKYNRTFVNLCDGNHIFGDWKYLDGNVHTRFCIDITCDGKETVGHEYQDSCCTACGIVKNTESLSTGSCGDNARWMLCNDGTLVIFGTGTMSNYSSYSPKAPWDSLRSSIKTVIILGGVTSIGNSAFEGCSSLTSITIPDSVTSIGRSAFSGCSSLTSVTIGNGVTSIGNSAFEGCSSLTSIIIPNSVTSISECAFYNCSSLTSITIPDSVTSIGDSTFYNCSSLASIIFKSSTTKIYDLLFTIPSNSTIYGYEGSTAQSYAEEYNRTFVKFCDGNHIFGDWKPLDDSSHIKPCIDVTCDGGVYESHNLSNGTCLVCGHISGMSIIDGGVFCDTLIWSLCDDRTLIISGEGAFKNNIDVPWENYISSITTVKFDQGVTDLGDYRFLNYDSLEYFDVVEENSSYADVDGVLFDKSILNLIRYPNARDNTEYSIPDSVTSISYYAFDGCSYLENIDIGNGVASIANNAFDDCAGLMNINVADNNPSYADVDGVLFNKSITELIRYPVGKTATAYLIPYGVTTVGSRSFYDCDSLKNVTIPDSVTSIGKYAFGSCSNLTSITIPDSITSIGEYAFWYCSSLTSITISDSVTSIGDDAFWGCSSLAGVYISDLETWCNISFGGLDSNPLYYAKNLYLSGELVTELVIPDGVTAIKNYAFYYCNSLSSIVISDDVTIVGDYAFYNCDSLTRVVIPNSVASLGNKALSSCGALTSVVFESATTIIYDSADTIPASVTIYGYENSTAKVYAEKYDRPFINITILSEKPSEVSFNFNAYVCDDEKVIFTWDPIIDADEYIVYYRKARSTRWKALVCTDTIVTVDFDCTTTYEFKVSDGVYESQILSISPKKINTFTLSKYIPSSATPAMILQCEVVDQKNAIVDFKWNDMSSAYKVYYRKMGSAVWDGGNITSEENIKISFKDFVYENQIEIKIVTGNYESYVFAIDPLWLYASKIGDIMVTTSYNLRKLDTVDQSIGLFIERPSNPDSAVVVVKNGKLMWDRTLNNKSHVLSADSIKIALSGRYEVGASYELYSYGSSENNNRILVDTAIVDYWSEIVFYVPVDILYDYNNHAWHDGFYVEGLSTSDTYSITMMLLKDGDDNDIVVEDPMASVSGTITTYGEADDVYIQVFVHNSDSEIELYRQIVIGNTTGVKEYKVNYLKKGSYIIRVYKLGYKAQESRVDVETGNITLDFIIDAAIEPCEHIMGDWEMCSNSKHIRHCTDDTCQSYEVASHIWNKLRTIKATCLKDGVEVYMCECGEVYAEIVQSTGEHTYDKWWEYTADEHIHYCTTEGCNASETSNHIWNSGDETTAPTCATAGVKTFTCSDCGTTYTEAVPATDNHTYGKWQKCDGNSHIRYCTGVDCDASETAEHVWDKGLVTTKPTCATEGIKTFTCTDCDATYTESVPATGEHVYGDWQKLDDDKHIHYCTGADCEASETADHIWNAGAVTTEPTCATNGVKTYTCSDCGATYTESVPATGEHVYGEWEQYDEPNHIHYCTGDDCDASETESHEYSGSFDMNCNICDHEKASSGDFGENMSWQVTEDGALSIGGTGDVDISGDAPWNEYLDGITSVTVSENVASIDTDMFEGMTNLTIIMILSEDVIIEDSVSAIPSHVVIYGYAGSTAELYASKYGREFVNMSITAGDINDDDTVDKNDAIYLLYSVLFGESQYPLNQTCDFNADGSVDKNDAIYLLYHALFGETSYPLN